MFRRLNTVSTPAAFCLATFPIKVLPHDDDLRCRGIGETTNVPVSCVLKYPG
jgi:hypothetical protein